jgi:rifampicin phosphotransferase
MSLTTASTGILSLVDARDDRLVGGKAAGLHHLVRLGANVPAGFVVSAPAVAQFESATIPPDLWQDILVVYRSLRAPIVIVRSSGLGEDSSEASFAGQLDSIADVRNEEELRSAVLRCGESSRSGRVLAYEASRGRRLAGLAIVVQEQVASAVSGVVFSEDPGGRRGALIEYCTGAGEELVSGRVNPGRMLVDEAGAVRHLAHVSCNWGQTPEAAAVHIASEARRIASVLGAPQDIEWTIDRAGRCWLVQTRPITVKAHEKATEPSVLWSNANVNENFPDPISPLLYSVAAAGYYHYFRNLGRAFGVSRTRLAAIDEPLHDIIGVHGGRMYYNLTSIHTVLRAVPFGEELAQSFNQFVGATELAPTRSDKGRWARVPQWLEVARIAASVASQYALVTRRVAKFERTADAFAASTHPSRLPRLGRSGLRQRLRAFMDIRCNRWKDAALADAAAMVCYAALKAFLNRSLPGKNQDALHNTLLKALPDLVSGRPAIELWKLSRIIRSNDRLATLFQAGEPEAVIETIRHGPEHAPFSDALDAYLESWGFRCSSELMLTVPSFQENPAALVPLLRAYAQSDAESPETRLLRERDDRLLETQRVLQSLSWSRACAVRELLGWTQRAIQLRERARLKQALLYSRLRRIALAIGDELVADGRLDGRDAVFMLTVDEIDRLLAGASMFPDDIRGLTQLRRRSHQAFGDLRPPDTFELPRGAYFTNGVDAASPAVADERALAGTSACGGRSTGRATVLADVSEAHRLAAGDILVTRQTDPGWGPVFPLISGLVMERGGMLSHGAIIAREFGIPSVVGVHDATRLIPPGSLICLDGDRGTVRLVSDHLVIRHRSSAIYPEAV